MSIKKIFTVPFRKIKSLGRRLLSGTETDQPPVKKYIPYAERNPTLQPDVADELESIFKGSVPERFYRIVDEVPGNRILEIGAGAGVLSLLLSKKKEYVCGLELMPMRHEVAKELKSAWMELGEDVSKCEFLNRDITQSYEILENYDTIVMNRVIYHLREDIKPLFQAIRLSNIEYVVLVGNRGKEKLWRDFKGKVGKLEQYLFYASEEGMVALINDIGFNAEKILPSTAKDDPIVIGSRNVK